VLSDDFDALPSYRALSCDSWRLIVDMMTAVGVLSANEEETSLPLTLERRLVVVDVVFGCDSRVLTSRCRLTPHHAQYLVLLLLHYSRFMAFCPGLPRLAGTRRTIHPLTYPDHHPTYISLFHNPYYDP